LTKLGKHLKIDDGIRRRVDENGVRVNEYHTWKVDLVYNDSLSIDELMVGQEYGISLRLENAVIPYRLTGVDLESKIYTFNSLQEDKEDIKATSTNLPSVYHMGVTRRAGVEKIIVGASSRAVRVATPAVNWQ